MRTERFGSAGVAVPVIGQGTWEMERGDTAANVRAVRGGLDAGLTHVDTAEMYGSGRVEELVGEAIAGRRDEVFLVSKVLPSNASYEGTLRACERSLARLGTDRVDLYLLHWPSSHPLEETVRALLDLRAQGKALAVGVSNFDAALWAGAVALAGPGVLATNQVLYHLEERAVEHRVLPACEADGAVLTAYSPFGAGAFPAPDSPGGRELAAVAAEVGATPRQVALAFLVRRPSTFAIPRTFTPSHVADNAAAGDLVLDAASVARLDAAFPRGPEPAVLPTI